MKGSSVALMALALPFQATADVLICEFTPALWPDSLNRAPFTITINTHHGADTPRFEYGGVDASIVAAPDDGEEAPSFVTLGHGNREIVTLFNGFDALHTRHFQQDGMPVAQSAIGRCTSFY